MEIVPLQNYVLLEEIKGPEKTELGIIIPEGSMGSDGITEQGKVISYGEQTKIKIQLGDVVLFKPYGFDEFEVDKKLYRIGREDNIFAIIKNDK